jgi:hypothetical protein
MPGGLAPAHAQQAPRRKQRTPTGIYLKRGRTGLSRGSHLAAGENCRRGERRAPPGHFKVWPDPLYSGRERLTRQSIGETRGRSGMGETRFKVALVTRLPCEVARAATFQAPPSARESARTRNVRVRGQRVCSSHGGRSASGYRSIWPQRCRGRGPTGKESCGVSMLLAGDAVVVSVEPAVVRSPDVVEPSAALDVRDRVCPAACLVVSAQLIPGTWLVPPEVGIQLPGQLPLLRHASIRTER